MKHQEVCKYIQGANGTNPLSALQIEAYSMYELNNDRPPARLQQKIMANVQSRWLGVCFRQS